MKFVAPREDFLRGINIASRAISTNNTLPILSNILLRAEGTKLYFESTNLEIAIRYFMQTEIANEGKITLPARLFQNYVSLLNDKEVHINISDGNTVNISSSESKTQIKGLSANDFPAIPTVERKFEITLPAKKLAEGISEVVFAASANAARPILSGMLLQGTEKTLKLVATDSYRLAEKTLELKNELDSELHAIIPARTMTEVGRLLNENDEKEVVLVISDNQILFKIGNVELTSRLIEGQFPNYAQVIPQSSKSNVQIEKSELTQNIKRVGLFAKENNNNIKLQLAPSNKKLIITTDATQIGVEEASISAEIQGEENKIALNSEYLLDVLNALPQGKITIDVDNKLSPALLKHEKLSDYLHIVMPLKL